MRRELAGLHQQQQNWRDWRRQPEQLNDCGRTRGQRRQLAEAPLPTTPPARKPAPPATPVPAPSRKDPTPPSIRSTRPPSDTTSPTSKPAQAKGGKKQHANKPALPPRQYFLRSDASQKPLLQIDPLRPSKTSATTNSRCRSAPTEAFSTPRLPPPSPYSSPQAPPSTSSSLPTCHVIASSCAVPPVSSLKPFACTNRYSRLSPSPSPPPSPCPSPRPRPCAPSSSAAPPPPRRSARVNPPAPAPAATPTRASSPSSFSTSSPGPPTPPSPPPATPPRPSTTRISMVQPTPRPRRRTRPPLPLSLSPPCRASHRRAPPAAPPSTTALPPPASPPPPPPSPVAARREVIRIGRTNRRESVLIPRGSLEDVEVLHIAQIINPAWARQRVERKAVKGEGSRPCWFEAKRPEKRPRPKINLGNTRATKDRLLPQFHHLLRRFATLPTFATLDRLIDQTRDRPRKSTDPRHDSLNIQLSTLAVLSTSTAEVILAFSHASVNGDSHRSEINVSHRCGQRDCFNPEHLVLEDCNSNASRDVCAAGVVKICSHSPPCIINGELMRSMSVEAGRIESGGMGLTGGSGSDGSEVSSGRSEDEEDDDSDVFYDCDEDDEDEDATVAALLLSVT